MKKSCTTDSHAYPIDKLIMIDEKEDEEDFLDYLLNYKPSEHIKENKWALLDEVSFLNYKAPEDVKKDKNILKENKKLTPTQSKLKEISEKKILIKDDENFLYEVLTENID